MGVFLTERQDKVLRVIHEYIKEHNRSPSFADIARLMGVTAPAAQSHVEALERKGLIKRIKKMDRSISITTKGRLAIRTVRFLMWGQIAAGDLVECYEDPQEWGLERLLRLKSSGDYFILRVNGDSMVNKGIHDGDLVLFENADWASSGDVVAVYDKDNRVTLKTFMLDGDKVRLVPANPRCKPIVLPPGEVRIIGIARTALRHIR
jgi:repressor LexA